jgi:hypothetical protein
MKVLDKPRDRPMYPPTHAARPKRPSIMPALLLINDPAPKPITPPIIAPIIVEDRTILSASLYNPAAKDWITTGSYSISPE